MTSSSRENSSWQVLIVVLLLGYGAFRGIPFLQSQRPEMPTVDSPTLAGVQTFRARLWQDPLAACAKGSGAPEESFASCANVEGHASSGAHVLAVLTTGGPYPADTELRLRNRYAVIMALLQNGYVPMDAEHLGAFKCPLRLLTTAPAPDLQGPFVCDLSVPFEWFKAAPRPANETAEGASSATRAQQDSTAQTSLDQKPVLVLWINEDLLGSSVSSSLASILLRACACTGQEPRQPACFIRDATRITVIGPLFSDDLLALKQPTQDLRWAHAMESLGVQRPVRVLSCSATIPDAEIDCAIEKSTQGETPFEVHRTLATDDTLVGLLCQELEYRGVFENAATRHPRVVLLAEADTAYGRSLAKTFSGVYANKAKIIGGSACKPPDVYYYLRGMDGKLVGPRQGAGAMVAANREKDPDRPGLASLLVKGQRGPESPTGGSQFDYLRRLVDAIKLSESADEPVRAVGIFSTDVYDKLIILQAMRDRFPGVVFFTTDADSALLVPDQYGWTRNVVVASGFELALDAELQNRVPPFRDCYQTAEFFAVTCALLDKDPGQFAALPNAKPVDLTKCARVYEIGRRGFVNLSGSGSASRAYAAQYSPVNGVFSLPRLFIGLIGLLLLAAFARVNSVLAVPMTLGRGNDWRAFSRLVLIALLIAGVIGLFVWRVLLPGSRLESGGEPLSLFGGVSAWPTEAIRVLVCLLAVLYAFTLLRQWSIAQRQIGEEFGYSPKTARTIFFVMNWYRGSSPAVFSQLWRNYCRRASWGCRLGRSGIMAVLYFVTVFMLFQALPLPATPVRGAIARAWDQWIIMSCAFALTWFTFLVWDATRLCNRFIVNLTDASSDTLYANSMKLRADRVDPAVVASWLDVKIIGAVTASIGMAVYYPMFFLFLIMAARSQIFDDWRWGTALVITLVTSVAITLLAAWSLRRAAEDARKIELGRLHRKLACAQSAAAVSGVATANQQKSIEQAIQEIRDDQTGAFARWKDQPLIRAILIPASGAVGLALLDMSNQWF